VKFLSDYRPPMYGHTLLAVFPNLGKAGDAIRTLELAGIEASHISLLGPGPAAARAKAETPDGDSKEVGDVAKKVMAGAALGTAVGAATGFLGGLAAFAISGIDPVLGAGVWLSLIAGSVGGGAVGGLVAGMASMRASEAWELTYQSVKEGTTVVGVHTENPKERTRASEVLDHLDPQSLQEFDAAGDRISH
jgi:hypothetical protein